MDGAMSEIRAMLLGVLTNQGLILTALRTMTPNAELSRQLADQVDKIIRLVEENKELKY